MTMTITMRSAALPGALAILETGSLAAQEAAPVQVTRIEVTPTTLTLEVGEKAQITATAYDADASVVDVPFLFFTRGGRGRLAVDRTRAISSSRSTFRGCGRSSCSRGVC